MDERNRGGRFAVVEKQNPWAPTLGECSTASKDGSELIRFACIGKSLCLSGYSDRLLVGDNNVCAPSLSELVI